MRNGVFEQVRWEARNACPGTIFPMETAILCGRWPVDK
jgi:hypothetical protein